jgi:cytidine deaminase
MTTKEEIEKLIAEANRVENNAFIFKSRHAFGAAVLTTDGEIYGGCNIDGVISSLGTCAESCALNHAVTHGKYNIKAVAVVDEDEFVYPCGVCLQYIAQFYQTTGEEIEIISAKKNGEYQVKGLKELLPEVYLTSGFKEILETFKNK